MSVCEITSLFCARKNAPEIGVNLCTGRHNDIALTVGGRISPMRERIAAHLP